MVETIEMVETIKMDRSPKILVPYPGPSDNADVHDIFVYMRPETNGVVGESAIVRVIEKCPFYRKQIRLIYLANLPGEFICRRKIIEQHYATKIHFAIHGKHAFTEHMRQRFEQHFRVGVDLADIQGAFDALNTLCVHPEDLFRAWVDDDEILIVNGQTIKHIDDIYVVNYDAPALLYKHNNKTDIAVMLFRVSVSYEYFHSLVEHIHKELVQCGATQPNVHTSRAFHYSKSPFEQVLDARGHLIVNGDQPVDIADLSFVRYLMHQGVGIDVIRGILHNPIARFQTDKGTIEDTILLYTQYNSYAQAYEKLRSMIAQYYFSA